MRTKTNFYLLDLLLMAVGAYNFILSHVKNVTSVIDVVLQLKLEASEGLVDGLKGDTGLSQHPLPLPRSIFIYLSTLLLD